MKHIQFIVWVAGVLGVLCLSSSACYAQHRINNLIFNSTDQIIGLDFTNTESPEVFYTGKRANATIGEGIAHAENRQGEIIFWVNSSGVYDRENGLMPGSAGILAHPSSTEIVISPFPDNPDKYYIFYNNQLCSTLYYSVVEMGRRGGLGDVAQRNVALSPEKNFAEGLEVIRIPCTKNYWLIANECGKGLTRFKVTEEGLSAGELFLSNTIDTGGRGELDYHKGKLGYAITFSNRCLLADFDPVSGTALNSRYISFPSKNGTYGLEFSPDASKLYVTDLNNQNIFGNLTGSNLFSYDLSTGLIRSWSIGNTNTSCTALMEGLGHIEMGKDGKLYITQINGCQIIVVDDPNSNTADIRRINVGTVLSAGISDHIQSDFLDEDLLQEASVAVEGEPFLCASGPVLLSAVVASAEEKLFQWFRNGVSIPNATNRAYAATEAGAYAVRISNTYGCSLLTAATPVGDNRIPVFEYQQYHESCGGQPVVLSYRAEGYRVVWFDGSEGYTKQVTESGSYQLSVHKGSCSRTEVFEVRIHPKEQYKIPNVITVNGDGRNDFFEIKELKEPVQVWIYNRWGTLLFFSADYQNNWQGEGLPVGTYYYRLLPTRACGEERKGWVQLMRGEPAPAVE